MTTLINPSALRAYRVEKKWTQGHLAERAKISLPTIKRIEGRKEGNYPARDSVAVTLAKVLGKEIHQLQAEPETESERAALRQKHGLRTLRMLIDGKTTLAFDLVEKLYGVSMKSQIEMAPLFTALLAEGSFAWRGERVGEIEDAASTLEVLGGGSFSFANAAYMVSDGARDERLSIRSKDLFGKMVGEVAFQMGFDPSISNPFADYLASLASKVDDGVVEMDRSFGWKTSEDLPDYRVGNDIVWKMAGGDSWAMYALEHGHVRLKEIPPALLGDDLEKERWAWLADKVPAEVRADMAALTEKFALKLP